MVQWSAAMLCSVALVGRGSKLWREQNAQSAKAGLKQDGAQQQPQHMSNLPVSDRFTAWTEKPSISCAANTATCYLHTSHVRLFSISDSSKGKQKSYFRKWQHDNCSDEGQTQCGMRNEAYTVQEFHIICKSPLWVNSAQLSLALTTVISHSSKSSLT